VAATSRDRRAPMRGAELERCADETAHAIFPSVRSFTERARGFSREDLVVVLRAQLCRPGRPGGRLSPPLRDAWLADVDTIAAALGDPTDQRALLSLCRDVSRAVWSRLPSAARTRRDPRATVDSPRRLARSALIAEWSTAGDDKDRVRRAVTRAFRERGRAGLGTVRLELPDGDPLRAMLDLPATGVVRLPKNDVRVHLVRMRTRAGEHNALPDLLRRASRFSERTLRPLLGEELWGMCRPVGFSDKRGRIVTVRVDNAALAHEISLRKRELLSRLRAGPGFESVKDVRFKVEQPSARPIIGGREDP